MSTDLSTSSPSCRDHPMRPAVTRCAACKRPLCDACYCFRVAAKPSCARCAYEVTTRSTRRASLAVAFLSFCVGGGIWATRRYDLWDTHPGTLIFGVISAAIVAAIIVASGRDESSTEVENRDPTEEVVETPPVPPGASPYRVAARRVLMAAAPRVSGRATALIVAACLLVSAVLLPASVKLPRWVEVELVLGAWWAIVGTVLSVLLYRGFRLRDDFVYFAPWNRPEASEHEPDEKPRTKSKGSSGGGCSWSDGCSGADGCSGIDGEGVVVLVVVGIALAAAFGAAWVLVEFAMPLVFFVLYAVFMRAIGRVANDRHECEGSLSRSVGWGALWATVYIVPVAGITWALHALGRS